MAFKTFLKPAEKISAPQKARTAKESPARPVSIVDC